jgi:membrane protein insertase Oxa1/YidC/SpoIIIJ
MRMKLITVLVAVLLSTALVPAQQPASKSAPSLKPEVALKIRDIQLKQMRAEAEFQQIQARIKALQEEYAKRQAELAAALATALKDSGIDEKQWTLDPETLMIAPARVAETGTKKP